ncbi:RING finger protein 212B isoform X7 [Coturnix japonica]|uniref:RING finger protein 212B isoform X7 n=1 Tax=Coturnix japonica TaxID=93934 RepID=UPI0013A5CB9C|nr:RING finger protein 212B isoform X7 [Coturnix japonica]
MAAPCRDWFHCNRCYRQDGARFSVTSCGHVLCEPCLGAGPCPICAAACRRFPIPEQLEETLFLKSPAAIARQRLAHISQAWRFQQAQVDLLLAFHRDTARRAEAALRDARRALDSKQRSPLPGGRAAPSPGSTPGLAHRATLLASHTPLWAPFTTPPLPVTVLPAERQHFFSAGLQPPRG